MQDLKKALPHLIMAVVVIAAAVTLAVANKISGAEALAIVSTAGGMVLGGTIASASTSTAAGALADASGSSSHTPTPTPPTPTPTVTTPSTST